MTLEDFISDSISQIINGVKKAQEHASKNGAKINPASFRIMNSQSAIVVDDYRKVIGQLIDFDVAVTTKEEDIASGGAGVVVSFIKAGIDGRTTNENTLTNRIKFSIPISLPNQKEDNE